MTGIQQRIEPMRNYGICEAAELCELNRKTLLNYIKKYPKMFPITHDPITHRKRILGKVLIVIRDRQY